MWRIVLIFAAILVVGDVTGLFPEVDEIGCRDEPEGKHCPPTCQTCTCAFHSLKTAPASVVELKTVELTARTIELPPAHDGHGLLAPAPAQRPPIA